MNFVAQHVIINVLEKQIEISAPVFKSTVVRKKVTRLQSFVGCEHFNYLVKLRSYHPVTI